MFIRIYLYQGAKNIPRSYFPNFLCYISTCRSPFHGISFSHVLWIFKNFRSNVNPTQSWDKDQRLVISLQQTKTSQNHPAKIFISKSSHFFSPHLVFDHNHLLPSYQIFPRPYYYYRHCILLHGRCRFKRKLWNSQFQDRCHTRGKFTFSGICETVLKN